MYVQNLISAIFENVVYNIVAHEGHLFKNTVSTVCTYCRYELFDMKISGPCMNRWCTTGEYGGHKRAPCRFIIALD